MGNMQFNLDKSYDSIPCKNASSAAEVIKSIGQIENKVGTIFTNARDFNCFNYIIVPIATGRHVLQVRATDHEENEKSDARYGSKIRLAKSRWCY